MPRTVIHKAGSELPFAPQPQNNRAGLLRAARSGVSRSAVHALGAVHAGGNFLVHGGAHHPWVRSPLNWRGTDATTFWRANPRASRPPLTRRARSSNTGPHGVWRRGYGRRRWARRADLLSRLARCWTARLCRCKGGAGNDTARATFFAGTSPAPAAGRESGLRDTACAGRLGAWLAAGSFFCEVT